MAEVTQMGQEIGVYNYPELDDARKETVKRHRAEAVHAEGRCSTSEENWFLAVRQLEQRLYRAEALVSEMNGQTPLFSYRRPAQKIAITPVLARAVA